MILTLSRLLPVSAFLLVCAVSSVNARPIPPLEGLEALRKGFSGISDFSAEITQEKRLSLMKRNMNMNGTVRFRKPDQFFMAINPPYSSRMVLKDSTIEIAGGPEGKRNRIVLPPEQGLGRWFSKLVAPVTSLPEGVSIQADLSNSVYTLTITPQGKGQVKELVISFLADGTIRRLMILEQNGDRATMTFRNLRRNIGLTDREFRLEP
ncbi:MAG: outer membrane lipoprotein carrier protein LolA [Geobacteraceae bacterium]|nr:outer membrane lipoprotein carrier protein LolA [Geobacteraceae bacterium]